MQRPTIATIPGSASSSAKSSSSSSDAAFRLACCTWARRPSRSKMKDYSCEFAFRDRGRLIRALSRPGVFSHRHIDPGARHLIDAMEIGPGDRVLDIGCGAGTVSLAAAFRAEGVQVHAVDSNVRAIECTRIGAEFNGLANVTAELNAVGNFAGAGSFDLALANPPYYSGFRIARAFSHGPAVTPCGRAGQADCRDQASAVVCGAHGRVVRRRSCDGAEEVCGVSG